MKPVDAQREEKDELQSVADKYDIDVISLIAPTSEDRIKMIAGDAKGFIYTVSSMGVTGMRNEITTDLGSIVSHIKSVTDTPVAIGFGINTPEQAKKYSAFADGGFANFYFCTDRRQVSRNCRKCPSQPI